jgi:hypothetical protein
MLRMLILVCVLVLLGITLRQILQHRAPQSGELPQFATNAAPVTVTRIEANAAVVPAGQTTSTALEAEATLDWADRVEAARAIEEGDAEKSARLLAMYPTLPPEGQDEIAPELAMLTPDSSYHALAGILTDLRTPEPVLDVLFTDLLDRPQEIQLPTLLDLAKSPQHPKVADALDILGLQLGEDLGTDWDAWAKKISERLASRPE